MHCKLNWSSDILILFLFLFITTNIQKEPTLPITAVAEIVVKLIKYQQQWGSRKAEIRRVTRNTWHLTTVGREDKR